MKGLGQTHTDYSTAQHSQQTGLRAPGYGPQPTPGYGPQPTPGYGPQPTPGYGAQPTPLHLCQSDWEGLTPPLILNSGAPQELGSEVLCSEVLYSLSNYDCAPVHITNTFIKYVDNTTVIGLVSDNECGYRGRRGGSSAWRDAAQCSSLSLNTRMAKELIVDFRKGSGGHGSSSMVTW